MLRLNRRDFIKLLGLSPLLFSRLPQLSPRPAASGKPNFLILVFDTLSAPHLSLYGYPRRTAPNLERLAQRANVYHRHYAAANFTSPGTASLLTGVYPWRHRAIHMRSQIDPQYLHHSLFALPEAYTSFAYTHNPLAYMLLQQERELIDTLAEIETLSLYSDSAADRWFDQDYSAAYTAELLRQRDYHTSASLFFSLFDRLRRSIQQARMEETYGDVFPRGAPSYYDEIAPPFLYFTLEQAVDWVAAQAGSQAQPFLGYIHLLPPHAPHTTTRQFNDLFIDDYRPPNKPAHALSGDTPQGTLNLLRRYYDESIAYVDAEFGRLFNLLEQSGALQNTWLIFTSDHGELFERGTYSHNNPFLYQPLLHIPLLIWQPGQTQRQDISTLTSNVDLLPTIFQAAGAPTPGWIEGQALPGLFASNPESPGRGVFALEAKKASRKDPLRQATLAVMRGAYKLIHYRGYPEFETQYELYDLINDPEELEDLYTPDHPAAKELKDLLAAQLANQAP